MAFDSFILIDGIEGESTDQKHADWIEVVAFGLGVRQKIVTTASSAGGASAERAVQSNHVCIRTFKISCIKMKCLSKE